MALGLIFGGCIILIYQKMKLQSKNYEILNKQKLRKKIYIYLPLTCFLFRNSLTTIYSRTIVSSSSGMSCKSSVSKIAGEFSLWLNLCVFLPLSNRAYFKGRAYIKIILKNHARSYFAGRSYYRGNRNLVQPCNSLISNCCQNFMKLTVADLGGGWEGCIPPHQPKSNDFGRKISLYFE